MSTIAPSKPKVLRRSEAADRLGVHPNTILSWAARGWLESVELPGGERRYLEDSVEALRKQIYETD